MVVSLFILRDNMANNLKTDHPVSFGPRVLLQRSELAALIGCACADWADVESKLTFFYAHLMGVYLPDYPGAEPPSHPVALQVLNELQSIHAKINLVKKLADWVIKDDEQRKDVQRVLDKLRKAGEGRNLLAHAVWGVCESEPEALILMPIFGAQMVYKKKDFELVLEKIEKARAELARIYNVFYQGRRKK